MKKVISVLTVLALLLFAFAGCSSGNGKSESSKPQAEKSTSQSDKASEDDNSMQSTSNAADESKTAAGSNAIVVYFSRTGEQYSVGVIDEGNTAIVAKMIAEKTGADIFETLPETDYYPYTYTELTEVAKKEQNENARPAIGSALPVMSKYDTVFIGAPVWWGDWPMIMYTFFESTDLSGKKLIPFSTHEGSGLSGFDGKLSAAVPDAEVLTGLAVRGSGCQNDKAGVKSKVDEWISSLGLS